jgi:hypothetical protein
LKEILRDPEEGLGARDVIVEAVRVHWTMLIEAQDLLTTTKRNQGAVKSQTTCSNKQSGWKA